MNGLRSTLVLVVSCVACEGADPHDGAEPVDDAASTATATTSATSSSASGVPASGAGGNGPGGASAGGGGTAGSGGAPMDWTEHLSQTDFLVELGLPSAMLVDPHAPARVAFVFSVAANGLGVWDSGSFSKHWKDTDGAISPKAWQFDHLGDLYVIPDWQASSVVHYLADVDTWVQIGLDTWPWPVPWWPPRDLAVASGPPTRVALFGTDAYYDATDKLGFALRPIDSYEVGWTPAPALGESIYLPTYLTDGSGEVYGVNADGDFGHCTSQLGNLACAKSYEFGDDRDIAHINVTLANPDAVYVDTRDGSGVAELFASFDRGVTFDPVPLPPSASASLPLIVTSPIDAKTLVVRVGQSAFSTHDLGATWTELSPPKGFLSGAGIDATGTLFVLADNALLSTQDY